MAMTITMKFKICLVNENFDVLATRRYNYCESDEYLGESLLETILASPDYVGPGYECFVKLIEDFFPEIREKKYSIMWKDKEGDKVTISSNDELQIAFAECVPLVHKNDQILKFYIVLPMANSKEIGSSITKTAATAHSLLVAKTETTNFQKNPPVASIVPSAPPEANYTSKISQ